jgi:exosortase A
MTNKKYSINSILLFSFTFLFLSAFCFTFFPVWKNLINLWLNSDEYSHGFFIVPLALYIIWQKKDKLSALPIEGSWIGFLMSFLALLLFFIGHIGLIETLKSLTMIFFIAGSIAFLFGFSMLKELLFPISILLFMIPIPSQIFAAATIHLQLFVSTISSNLVSAIGVPLYREGNVIHLSDHTLQVVQACSGMRSLISLLTLSAVFGYLTLRSNILRTLLFCSGFPIAVFVNIVRVALLISFIHFLGIDLTHGTLHTVFGLGIFFLALALLFIIKELLTKWDSPSSTD